jgi:hypothetical protein
MGAKRTDVWEYTAETSGQGHSNTTVTLVATVAPPSSTAAILLLFKNPVRTAKETQNFTVTKINRLTLFKEIIAVYSEI